MTILILPSLCRGVWEELSASNILSSTVLLLIWVAVFCNQLLYFPRHFFKDDEEWTEFTALVSRKLKRI